MNSRDKKIFILILTVIGVLIALSFALTWKIASVTENRYVAIERQRVFQADAIEVMKKDIQENKEMILEYKSEPKKYIEQSEPEKVLEKTEAKKEAPTKYNDSNPHVRKMEIAEYTETGKMLRRYEGDTLWVVIDKCSLLQFTCEGDE